MTDSPHVPAAPLPRLSVLDLAPVSEGSDAATALRNSVELAQLAESLGYQRYWLAEHHFVAVASSSPITLTALIAAATSTIRVGAAAVQIGFHTPLTVVEAFGTIDALNPGRIDLGLGRSVQRVTEATKTGADKPQPQQSQEQVIDGLLLPAPYPVEQVLASRGIAAYTAVQRWGTPTIDFADAVDDILALLDGTFEVNDVKLNAVPGTGADVQVWIFGSSKGQSAQVAGALGLPFGANYHALPATLLESIEAYRAAFRPSSRLSKPYVSVSADVVVADDDSTAAHLASTYGQWVYGIRQGGGASEYPNPANTPPLTDEQRGVVDDRVRTQFVGSPETVAEQLSTLARVTGADELVITTETHDFESRKRSYELLAKVWGR